MRSTNFSNDDGHKHFFHFVETTRCALQHERRNNNNSTSW